MLLLFSFKHYKLVKIKWRESEINSVAISRKGKGYALGLQGDIGNFLVAFNAYFHVVKGREVGENAGKSAVNRRRVENMKGEEVAVIALAKPYSSAGRKVLNGYCSVVNSADTVNYIPLEYVITRGVIALKYGVSKIKNVTLGNQSGIVCRFGLVGGVLVSAEMG